MSDDKQSGNGAEASAQHTQQQTQDAQGSDGASSIRLEDVYREFNVQPQRQPEQSTQGQPAQQHNTQQTVTEVPDPVTDPDGFRRYQATTHAALMDQISSINQNLTRAEQQRAQSAEKADIDAAVSNIAGKVEHLTPEFVKVALGQKYLEDDAFKSVWENRAHNKAAFDRALTALTNEFREKYAIRTDPQIAENQRAMSEATRATNDAQHTDEKSELEARLMKQNDAEFARSWRRIRGGG